MPYGRTDTRFLRRFPRRDTNRCSTLSPLVHRIGKVCARTFWSPDLPLPFLSNSTQLLGLLLYQCNSDVAPLAIPARKSVKGKALASGGPVVGGYVMSNELHAGFQTARCANPMLSKGRAVSKVNVDRLGVNWRIAASRFRRPSRWRGSVY